MKTHKDKKGRKTIALQRETKIKYLKKQIRLLKFKANRSNAKLQEQYLRFQKLRNFVGKKQFKKFRELEDK